MNRAPINIFQRLMRKWDAVHPYNAAQVMKVRGVIDAETARSCWAEALSVLALGQVKIEGGQYGFVRVEDARLNVLPAAESGQQNDPSTRLPDYLSAELNRPFPADDQLPFRPFILDAGDHFFAGVVYQHWLADSASIRMLMREWFLKMIDPSAARNQRVALPSAGYWDMVGPHRVGWDLVENTLGMIRRHTRLRRAQKIASHALADHRTHFQLFPAPDGLVARLRPFAQRRRVKLNDIFLAALLETCARHVPLQPRPSRTDVAVGSIVDLRPFCPADLSNTFGLLLGFTNVVCRPTDLVDFDHLLRIVSNQTQIQKETGVAPSSLVWMSAAMTIGKLSRPDELYHFYRKELPLAGGISNVDLRNSWAAAYHPDRLLEYIRVSPSGPMTPLVITTTTLGEKFHVGLTHRIGLIDEQRAAALAKTFLDRVSSLC